ncbi:MAG TPA: serine/threonine-protein kinase [Gemmataceae bacterium]
MSTAQELIGGYRLRTLLQTGQNSQVYEVIEPVSNRHFAMKILLPEKAGDPEQRQTLFHEAEVGQKLRHDNVIHILKVSRDRQTPHFIMEFFRSGSLGAAFREPDPARRKERLQFIRDNALKIFKQAATGLAYMHAKGWLHRDIKPDNMLVNAQGNLKLIDFAIAQRMKKGLARWFHRRRKAAGTPSYMAPEQIRDEVLDERADVYSFGCSLYELTTGRKPFTGNTQRDLLSKHLTEKPVAPQSHNPDLTEEFSQLVLRMLAKKREERPRNFHEILMALRGIRVFKSAPAGGGEGGEG